MLLKNLEQLFDLLEDKNKKRLVLVSAINRESVEAVFLAVNRGLIDATLVGDENTIKDICEQLNENINKYKVIHSTSPDESAQLAINEIQEGRADIIAKGHISTDKYMKALLAKSAGLRIPDTTVSHVTVVDNPNYHKLLVIGDAAVLPHPDMRQKITIARNLINVSRRLGVEKPKLAVVCATEKVLEKVPSTVDAAKIAEVAHQELPNAIVEGPLSLDLAIDKHSADVKGVNTPVAGDADCLLFPSLDAANVFFKTNSKLGNGMSSAILVGLKVPVVLTSRADNLKTRLYSIALAVFQD